MTVKNKMFQPGLALYEVVVGTFKAAGTTFSAWCKEAGVNETVARNALKGVSTGTQGQEMVERLIDGAGREVVEVSYRVRMQRHLKAVERATSAEVAA